MADKVGNKREIPSTPREPSRSPKRINRDPSSPMEISPEALNSVSKHLKIGGGLHFEEMEGFTNDILHPVIDDIHEIISTIVSSKNVVSKTEAAIQLKILVSKGHFFPILLTMKSDILLPNLIVLMADSNSPKLQYLSTSIVADITMCKSVDDILLRGNVIGTMAALLCCDNIQNPRTKEEAVRALGNIAGNSDETRLLVIKTALRPLLELYLRTPPDLENVSLNTMTKWTITSLFDGAAPPDFPYEDTITIAKDLLQSKASDGHKEVACRTLHFLTQDSCEKIQDETITSTIQNLIQLQSSYTVYALKLVTKIMSPALIDSTLASLNCLLQSGESKTIKQEVCQTIISLTKDYAQEMIDAGIGHTLMSLSQAKNQSVKLKRIALSAVSTMTDPTKMTFNETLDAVANDIETSAEIKAETMDVISDATESASEIKLAETMDVIADAKQSAAEIKVNQALEEVGNASAED